MSKVTAYSKTGAKKEAQVTLAKEVFGLELNHDLLKLAYNTYLANGRSAQAKVLTRGEVRGGGRKPWRQKGTGRARAGSIRIPHWKGGGVTFGPTGEENHKVQLPQKVRRLAIRQALSAQAADKKVIILESFDGGNGKVKTALALLQKIGVTGRVLLVVPEKTDAIDRSTRNIPELVVSAANYLNVFVILNADTVVITADAADKIENWLGESKKSEKKAQPKAATKTKVAAGEAK
ncbi:MAG TPA: 50S ribosomal protein L4 [Candidatus Dormibacteraeota bacterium]|nr:50S ribosomal protein L4 [Candidatus Dormibacteraeota bacterium]